jgi:NADH-ubiquinone oxidoreductase chain 4L
MLLPEASNAKATTQKIIKNHHIQCKGRASKSLAYPKGKIQIQTMNLSLLLFLVGILGFILNRKNIILMIIAIELMLLSVTLLILISSFSFDDGIGQTFSIFIISIAGAESVVGLSILVAYYRLRGNISLRT